MRIKSILPFIAGSLLLWPALPAWAADRWAELEDCELAAAGGLITTFARCGVLEVPENPADPAGRRIILPFAVIPARSGRPEPDPVVFLAGGPGQSARDTAPLMRPALRDINRNRDLIFLDQRGTGGSKILDCDFSALEAFTDPDWNEFERIVRECKAGWDADVRFYTTTDGAGDLERLREHLGLEQLNLIGGSYGTRMAQVYLRHYPERVRSVVLDGVVPTRLALGSEHAVKLDQSLGRLFAACRADEDCGERFPGLDDGFEWLKEHFRERKLVLKITNPRTGVVDEMEFTRYTLAGALRFLAYHPESQMKIPYLIHEAAASGDPTRLASQFLMVTEQMEEMIAFGLNLTVGCSEDWPRWPRDLDQSGTLLGNSMTEFYERFCAWWPTRDADPDFHLPFDSEVPILVLSGEFDPVTPPEYGDEATRQFSNSAHLVARGRGHIVLTNRCMSRVVTGFVEAASVENLDTGCMDVLGPEPFFIELTGPAP